MTITLAVAGKGGVGKTTLAALIIRYLMRTQPGSILAIDADPSSNLHLALGLELEWTVGDIRENLLEQVQKSLTASGAAMGALSGGMTKRDYLNYEIRSALAEGDRFDLIAMGRSEGPGCYCAVNHNLRDVIDSLSKHYSYVVIDNEAGLEHLSRRTTRDVHTLVVITNPSLRGIVAAERIAQLRHELNIGVEHACLVINGLAADAIPEPLQTRIDALDLPLWGTIPHDEQLVEFELNGRPLVEVPDESPVYQSVTRLMDHILAAE